MIVPETIPLPTPVRADARTTGISVIGAVNVIAANAAPTTIGQRSMGRSQKYTSVLSSRRSPMAAPPNTSATTGTTTAKPRLAMSCTASSRSASPWPSAKPATVDTNASRVRAMIRPRLVSCRSTTR